MGLGRADQKCSGKIGLVSLVHSEDMGLGGVENMGNGVSVRLSVDMEVSLAKILHSGYKILA